MIKALSVLCTIVLLTTGCTMFVRTNAVPSSTAEQVPANRILAYTEEVDGFARMTVTRDEGFMGGGCYLALVISGEVAARFNPKETATFFVPPGDTNMAVTPDPSGRGLCAIGSWDPVLERYTIQLDTPNLYRISLGAYRRPRLTPSVY